MLFTLLLLPLFAQNETERVLQEIENNSITLRAIGDEITAHKLNNRTGIYLSNPEVGLNYLWGSPTPVGHRTDLSITQSFDFPTAYLHRSKISKLENANLDLHYRAERLQLLLRGRQLCTRLAYYNAVIEAYRGRMSHAERIAELYQARVEQGDANILEKNKAMLERSTVRNEINRMERERSSLLNELKALNGGKPVTFISTDISHEMLPSDFDQWFAMAEKESPLLQYARGEIEISRQQVQLNRALTLPKLTAGYMSEKVVGERFQGVTVGITIPLWENKHRVKAAKAGVNAAETRLEEQRMQLYHQLQNLYMSASRLQQEVAGYRDALSSYSNEALLKKALDRGEISLLHYLLEITYYYEAMNRMLEAERDLGLTLAKLAVIYPLRIN